MMTHDPASGTPIFDNAPDDAALDRYFAGEATAAERSAVERWLHATPERAERHAAWVHRLWLSAPQASPVNVAGAERKFFERIKADAHHVAGGMRYESARPRSVARMRGMERIGRLLSFPKRPDRESVGMAGQATVTKLFRTWPRRDPGQHSLFRTIGFGVAAGAVFLWIMTRDYGASHRIAAISRVPAREIVTQRGKRATFDLADGTHVILAPESRLRIPAAFSTGTGLEARDIELRGEAYFHVRHDAARPFRVRTVAGIAEDLGTQFVITAYPETHGMRVLVTSGEVALRNADTLRSRPLAMLKAGDLAQLDLRGTLNVRQGVNTQAALAWMSGRLVFVDTPLEETFEVLGRWYDVDFRLNDASLAARPVNATFDRKSVQNVIEGFEVLLHAHAERHGQVVTFFMRSRQHMADSTTVTPQGGTGIR